MGKPLLLPVSTVFSFRRMKSKGWRPPIITDANGKADENFYFRLSDKTFIYRSCSITFRNEFYVFGGDTPYGGEKRQISKLTDCHLQRIGTLSFNHESGTCTDVNDSRIYLCFDVSSTKVCRYAKNPLDTFTQATSSVYSHFATSIAASECE